MPATKYLGMNASQDQPTARKSNVRQVILKCGKVTKVTKVSWLIETPDSLIDGAITRLFTPF